MKQVLPMFTIPSNTPREFLKTNPQPDLIALVPNAGSQGSGTGLTKHAMISCEGLLLAVAVLYMGKAVGVSTLLHPPEKLEGALAS